MRQRGSLQQPPKAGVAAQRVPQGRGAQDQDVVAAVHHPRQRSQRAVVIAQAQVGQREGVGRDVLDAAAPAQLLQELAGPVLLSGHAVHFKDNWENRRVPDINFDKEKTAASLQRMADVLAKEKAQLWINHDKAQRDSLKLAPEFYD